MTLIDVGGAHLEAFDEGAGERVLVLVHGAASSARIWHAVQRDLAGRGMRSVAVSLRGAGASDRGADPADYAPRQSARDVVALADALGLDRFVLVGHSLGTVVGRYVARDHAARLRALVLMAGPDPARAASTAARPAPSAAAVAPTTAWVDQHVGLAPDVRDALWRDIQANPPERTIGQSAPWPGLERTAEALTLPVLVALGDADDVVAPEVALRGYLALPEGRRHLHVFHGVGHYPNAQVPARLAALLDRFTATHAR